MSATTSTIAALAVRGGFHDGDWVESKDQDPNGGIRLLQLADVGDGRFRDRSDRWINEKAFAELGCSLVLPGDILIARMPDPIGRACIAPTDLGRAITVVDVAVLRCDPLRANNRYVMYALNESSTRQSFELMQDGATRQRIPRKRLGRIQILLPHIAEQRAIVNFLDEQTLRIDTLIDKQIKLIETLRERRVGVIANALGFGLEGAQVQPSGMAWLVTAPTGWRSIQVKNFGTVTLGKMLQPSESPGGVVATYMRAANVQPDGVLRVDDQKEMWFSRQELHDLTLAAGDVVVVEGGIGGFGRAAYLSSDLPNWGFQNSILRVRPYGENDGRFLTYMLMLARANGYIHSYCNIVSMPHFTADKVSAFRFCCPSAREQRDIADHLDEQTAKIDALIIKTQEHIALAKERRAALITAAVTGQIDVRTASRAATVVA